MIEDINEWKHHYINDEIIDIYSYLTDENIKTLKLLEFNVENKLYTERDFEFLEMQLVCYSDEDENGNLIMSEKLSNKNVDFNSYKILLDIFHKISLDYKL